jgi:hypothetical protein
VRLGFCLIVTMVVDFQRLFQRSDPFDRKGETDISGSLCLSSRKLSGGGLRMCQNEASGG